MNTQIFELIKKIGAIKRKKLSKHQQPYSFFRRINRNKGRNEINDDDII